jgi:O-antigen/teichoic acid export membrane protein
MDTKRIAKNTLFLYMRMLLVMFVSLFASRVLLNALGESDYGLNNVLAGVIVVFSFINGSLSAATSRYLTYALGKNEEGGVERVFAMSLKIHGVMALIVATLGLIFGGYIVNSVMNIPPERLFASNIVFFTVVVTSIISIVQVPFNSLIISHEKMSVYAYVGITEAIAKLVIPYLIMIYGGDKLIFLALLQMTLIVLMFCFYVWYCKRTFGMRLSFAGGMDRKLGIEMLGYSSWSMIGSGANMLKTQGVNLLINIFFGTVVNAANALAYSVNAAVISFTNNFTMAMNPQIIKTYASGKMNEMKQLLFSGGKMSFFLLMYLCLPLMFETEYILELWLVNVPEYANIFTRLVLSLTMVECFAYTIGYAVQATGKIRNYQIVISGLTMLNFPVSFLLYYLGMPPYTALIVSVCISFTTLISRLYFIKNLLKISPMEYFIQVLLRSFLVLGLSFPLPLWVCVNMEYGFLRLVCVVLMVLVMNSVVIWFVGLNQTERLSVKSLILKMIKR